MTFNSIDERNKVLLENIGLVKAVAKDCGIVNSENYDDLVQDGFEKFLNCLDRYDPSKGSLTTFMWLNLKQHMYKYNINMPERIFKLSCQIQTIKEQLTADLNRTPTNKEIAEYMGLSEKKHTYYHNEINKFNHISLDKENSNDEGESTNLYEKDLGFSGANPEEIFLRKEEVSIIQDAWAELNDEERAILSRRTTYCTNLEKPMSLRDVGEELGCSRTTIGTKEKQAAEHLKRILARKGLCA